MQSGTTFRGRIGAGGRNQRRGHFWWLQLVTSIVVSVPISMVKGSGSTINVWATVSQQIPTRHGGNVYQQFERQGQQAFSTIFIPSGAARDAENFEIPQDDVANYSTLIPDALTTTDNDGSGNTFSARANLLTALGLTAFPNGAPLLLPGSTALTDKNLLREALLPDVLRLNVTQPYGTLGIGAGGLQNGRILDYDDIDVALQLVRQLADVQFPTGIPGSGTGRASGVVALNCTAYPACQDRRVLVVLAGNPVHQAGQYGHERTTFEGNDLPFLTQRSPMWLHRTHLPGDPGTINYPPQQ